MCEFSMKIDPLTGGKSVDVPFTGHLLIEDPIYNKGSAFTEKERKELGLEGILPVHPLTIEQQEEKVYENYLKEEKPIDKYVYLLSLLDRNETLLYRLVLNHAEEMLPIVYTPTVGEAAKTFSHLFRKPRGLYVPADRISDITNILSNAPFSNIKLIVVTDGERILGLGDQGVGGMAIPVGKTSLYVVGAGLHPALCLPILLDVGTNNNELLNDSLYLGLKQERLTGEAYDAVVEEFVNGVKRCFPHALLQWEDFGKSNALRVLNRYRERICSFNDDIQGTGAVTFATIYAAIRAKGEKLKDQRYVFFGFGQAGYGIANTLVAALKEEGLSVKEAKERIYPLGHKGLVTEDMKTHEYQVPFARKNNDVSEWKLKKEGYIGLFDTVLNSKATVLIGTSGQSGAFTEDVIKQMAKNTEKPVILSLSNPTKNSECTPELASKVTGGKLFIATGSPFPPANIMGSRKDVPQCNNMYVFPGVGLGAIVSMTSKVTDKMFTAASKALASMVKPEDAKKGILLPEIEDIREVSENVAFAVAREARESGLGIRLPDAELRELVKRSMWEPKYLPYTHKAD
jgi:malate dehydrogenase (oxaloacetate-decarboxylating)